MISIADKKFRGRDKIVQKMTKDGLVDENLRTGEQKYATAEEKPKQEDSEKDAAEKKTDEEPVVDEEICMDAEDGKENVPRHHSTAKQSTDYYKAHQEDGKPYAFRTLKYVRLKRYECDKESAVALAIFENTLDIRTNMSYNDNSITDWSKRDVCYD